MADPLPNEFLFNGINGRTGDYLLKLKSDELRAIALGDTSLQKARKHFQVLKERNRARKEGVFLLEFGRDEDSLKDSGWGVVFPTQADMKPVMAVKTALQELLDWRKSQAGDLYLECLEGEKGVLPRDTADRFMSFYHAAPGVVRPRPGSLPYYLLLVGSPEDISFRFQYELDATYAVGRIYFDTLAEYSQYAHSVVMAEKKNLQLARRAVFFGTAHAGDSATQKSSEMLVKPLAADLTSQQVDWQIERLEPEQCRRARLEELLGHGDAPALLFTASHGVGFDAGDELQERYQGALLCQDLEAVGQGLSRDQFLAAEDITDDYNLHGLIAFHFACFGLGTPMRDNFTRPPQKTPQKIAGRDFLAALPRRLLSHPKGGALAVVGHIDRAWTYSFNWGEAGEQTGTFTNTFRKLMSGKTIGTSLDDFNIRYAQIAVRLTNVLDKSEVVPPDLSDLAGLWTANNDARGYVLLGDPAARLPVAPAGAPTLPRQALVPLTLQTPTGSPQSAAPAAAEPASGAPTPPKPAGNLAQDQASASKVLPSPPAPDEPKSMAVQSQSSISIAGPVTIQVTPQGFITLVVNPQVPAGAAQSGAQAFDFNLFGKKTDADTGETKAPGPLDNVLKTMGNALETIGEKVKDFADEITTLDIETYASSDLDKVEIKDNKFTQANRRAWTHIDLDGDTRLVVPYENGEVDQSLWEIHNHAVEQAQAYRAAMFKAIGDLITGIFPFGK